MTKKQRQLFLCAVKSLLLSLGAQQSDDRFTLQTKAGTLTLYPDEHGTIGVGTVFTRFDDPHAARKLVDCNRFSGKWNHHYFDGWDVETAITDCEYWLRKVIVLPSVSPE
ncbi:MAG TPA: hypothetical protein DD670_06835 [Planctomycetaceae bacterium]|nr:hypothetical protein [Planctomycetaceae bacterium]